MGSRQLKNPGDVEKLCLVLAQHAASIQEYIDGPSAESMAIKQKKTLIDRHVRCLKYLLDHDCWTNKDLSAVHAAVAAGEAYIAQSQ